LQRAGGIGNMEYGASNKELGMADEGDPALLILCSQMLAR
jgi:hypothetical protein